MLQGLDLPSRYLPSQANSAGTATGAPDGPAWARWRGRGCPSGPPPSRPSSRRSRRAAACRTAGALATDAPTIAAQCAPLLSRHDASSPGAALAKGVTDPEALAEAIRRLGDDRILFVDVKAETEGVFATYARATCASACARGVLVLGSRCGCVRPPGAARRRAVGGGAARAQSSRASESTDLLAPLLLLRGCRRLAYSLFLARAAADPGAPREPS